MPEPAPERPPIPPHHLCVIAAAVAAALGESARVRSVRLVAEEESEPDPRPRAEGQGPWVRQGRTRLMRSHAPRPRRPGQR